MLLAVQPSTSARGSAFAEASARKDVRRLEQTGEAPLDLILDGTLPRQYWPPTPVGGARTRRPLLQRPRDRHRRRAWQPVSGQIALLEARGLSRRTLAVNVT